MTKVIKGWN